MRTNTRIIECTRRIQFCAGHRVYGHESKCAAPHGHNYVAFITAHAPQLDAVGRVIDFSVLKERVGGWIDRNWDHKFLVFEEDRQLLDALDMLELQEEPNGIIVPQADRTYIMPSNPTAENMADYLLKRVCPDVLRDTAILVTKIRLWETENCYAEARLGPK